MRKMRKSLGILLSMALVLTSMGSLGGTVVTQAAANPELPRVYLDTTYSPPGGTVRTVTTGSDPVANGTNFQDALNTAQLGDIIVLQAGATYQGNFTIPNKTTGSGWIYIRSSAYSSLPAPGTRVAPSDAANMPKIITPNTSPAISTAQTAHHYRFVGVEIATTYSSRTYSCTNIVYLEYPDQSQLSQVPHDITFDRCYIHGHPTGNSRRGVTLNVTSGAVIDSYISEIHEVGADAQAIGAWSGPGPFKIVNNYLEGAGENFLTGGTDTYIQNLVASDIEFRHNYCYKPLTWFPNDSSYEGVHWVCKNLFELKNAQRVLVDGNVFENNWAGDQNGYAIVLTPRNQDGGNTWSIVQDVTFTNNIVRHSSAGILFLDSDDGYASLYSNDILVKNNVFEDISSYWNGNGRFTLFNDALGGIDNITIDHNTVFSTHSVIDVDGVGNNTNFIFTNNITEKGSYGVRSPLYSEGTATLNGYFPGYVFSKNIVAGANPSSYPANNYLNPPADMNAVGFVNYNGGIDGDYHLSATSPYKNAGTDAKDLGADIDALNAAEGGAITGTYPTSNYTVSSISSNRKQVGYDSSKTIDGITSSEDSENRWSGDSDFAYITYDLGSSKTVGSVDIDWSVPLTQQTTFDIRLSSDGVNYGTPVYLGTSTATIGYQNYAFTAQSARYVRITGHFNNNLTYSQWISISEVRIKDGSGTVLTISSAAANRQQTGYEATKTIDGITFSRDNDNRWSGDSIFAYITADLGSSKTVGAVSIDWYNVLNQQTTFEILVSTDGTNFTRVYNGTCAAQTGFQKVTFTDQSARYVKILGKGNNNLSWGQWISICELRVSN